MVDVALLSCIRRGLRGHGSMPIQDTHDYMVRR